MTNSIIAPVTLTRNTITVPVTTGGPVGARGPTGTGGAIVSATPPASPAEGQQWLNSNTGVTFTYYGTYPDGAWVMDGGGGGGTAVTEATVLAALAGDNPASDKIGAEFVQAAPMSALTDTDITTQKLGDILKWNGTEWENSAEPWKTFCCVGTSISTGGVVLTDKAGSRVNFTNNRHPSWLAPILGRKATMSGRTDGYPTFGFSGATVLELLTDNASLIGGDGPSYPVYDALATNSDVFILEGGANDYDETAEEIVSRLTDYWEYFTSRGRNVIAINQLPTDAANLASRGAKIKAVNDALPAVAASLGVILVDVCALTGSDGTTAVSTGWIHNDGAGVHPTCPYAYRIARAIAEEIRPHVSSATALVAGSADTRWFTANPSPCANSLPADWGEYAANTWAAQHDADGTNWQRVTATGTAWSIYGYKASGYVAGDKFRATARIRLAAGSDVGSLWFIANHSSGAGNTDVRAIYSGSGAIANTLTIGDELILLSDVLTVPLEQTDNVSWQLGVYCATGVVMDIRDIGLVRVGSALEQNAINPAYIGAVPVVGGTMTGPLVLNGGLSGVPQAISGTGTLAAVNLTTIATTIVTTGGGGATSTLAAGSNGQIKSICLITDGGTCVVTVTNSAWGGSGTITMDDANDLIVLQYLGSKWQVLTNSGCTLG